MLRGYVYDNETQLYYLQSRYYNPEWGRFISADTTDILTATPMGLTDKNLFAYCDNNPVIRADYGGEFWHIVAGGVIGGVASFAATLFTGGSFAEAGIAALSGTLSGALSMAVPSMGFLIDVGFSFAEEAAINAIKGKDISKETIVDTTVSVSVDAASSLMGDESRLTKEAMHEFVEAIPKTFKGNHPNVKAPAQKIIRRTSKTLVKESGETFAEKTIGNIFKNLLKALF